MSDGDVPDINFSQDLDEETINDIEESSVYFNPVGTSVQLVGIRVNQKRKLDPAIDKLGKAFARKLMTFAKKTWLGSNKCSPF